MNNLEKLNRSPPPPLPCRWPGNHLADTHYSVLFQKLLQMKRDQMSLSKTGRGDANQL